MGKVKFFQELERQQARASTSDGENRLQELSMLKAAKEKLRGLQLSQHADDATTTLDAQSALALREEQQLYAMS